MSYGLGWGKRSGGAPPLRRFSRVVISAAATLMLAVGSMSVPLAHAQPAAPSVLFVVDTSGSMYGQPLEQAKAALRAGIDALAPGQAAGLRSFAGECGDGGKLLVPVGTDNKDELGAAADGLNADGLTPTPDALRAAAGDLPPTGDRTIILISDGQSSCGDPCAVASELKLNLGINFRVHAVGFNAPEAAEGELSCIANATGGRYFTATNTAELSEAISSAVQTGSKDLKPGTDCNVPTFIGVRGSGEYPQDRGIDDYRASAGTEKPYNLDGPDNGMGGRLAPVFAHVQKQNSVNYAFNVMSVAYPAIPVGWTEADYYKAEYRESVEIGYANLSRIMAALHAVCGPETDVVLAGYSQGANVINKYLLETNKGTSASSELGMVKSVIQFGDPNSRPLRVGERHSGTAFGAFGVVAAGVGGADADINGYLQSNLNVVSTFCLAGDSVCNPLIVDLKGIAIHGSYGSPKTKLPKCNVNGVKDVVLYECAAYRVMQDLGYALPVVTPQPTLLQRGQQLLISVGGWLAKQPWAVQFASDPVIIGESETNESGSAILSVNVPADAEIGDHHLIIEQAGRRSVEVPVTVVEGEAQGDTPVFSFGEQDGLEPEPEPGVGTGSGGTGSSSGPFGGTGSSGG
ncbi:Cutinase [Rhodococcus sp. PML026]|nr:Cutinase [Rhodococcus sp. PML026]